MNVEEALAVAKSTTAELWKRMDDGRGGEPADLRDEAAEVLACEVERLRGLVRDAAKHGCVRNIDMCADYEKQGGGTCGICRCRKEVASWVK